MGAQAIGAITVNLFTSSIAKELTTMLNRIQAAYVVAQDQEQVDKLLEMKEQLLPCPESHLCRSNGHEDLYQ